MVNRKLGTFTNAYLHQSIHRVKNKTKINHENISNFKTSLHRMIPTMSCKDTKSTTLQLEKRVKGVSILLELGILEHPPPTSANTAIYVEISNTCEPILFRFITKSNWPLEQH